MDEHSLLTNIMKVYLAQTDSALQISKIISEHWGEEEMSPDSFIIGLIYRSMVSMNEKEMEESLKVADDILKETSSSEDYEEIDEEEEIIFETMEHEIGDKVILSRKIKTNTCNCDICAKARACLINYPTFEAKDELAQKFKDAIDNSLKIHKLNI